MSQSLTRGLQILGALADGPRSLDDLVDTLGVHKSTVLRLVRALEVDRFVRRDERHRFSLGSRLFELGAAALQQHAVRDVAWPHLQALGRRTGGQAVHLAAYEDSSAVYIAKVESTRPVRMYSRVGLPAPLHATAVGKVLAGGLTERQLEQALAATDFRALTPRTITDATTYRRVVAEVRERGWAEDAAEHEDFVNCIAAPVHDTTGRVIAAVSISVPDVILSRDEVRALLPQLQQTTADIEADWATDPMTATRERAHT
jgi:DNA-binding IclR family transcriptional regulator